MVTSAGIRASAKVEKPVEVKKAEKAEAKNKTPKSAKGTKK